MIHMSTKNYEENGYNLHLDLLIILSRGLCVHIVMFEKWANWDNITFET